jgi:hypothetical protein
MAWAQEDETSLGNIVPILGKKKFSKWTAMTKGSTLASALSQDPRKDVLHRGWSAGPGARVAK